MTRWLVSSDLDLSPFYRLVSGHPIMGPVASSLEGLKPLRPATLFEMAVIAITEQQLSLAAAFHIRGRLVRRFGKPIGPQWRFPLPDELASASLRALTSCGLSRHKAEYIKELAARVEDGPWTLMRSPDRATPKFGSSCWRCGVSGIGPFSTFFPGASAGPTFYRQRT